jgi:hypothetical protein
MVSLSVSETEVSAFGRAPPYELEEKSRGVSARNPRSAWFSHPDALGSFKVFRQRGFSAGNRQLRVFKERSLEGQLDSIRHLFGLQSSGRLHPTAEARGLSARFPVNRRSGRRPLFYGRIRRIAHSLVATRAPGRN